MLLLFWNVYGLESIGFINNLKWFHSGDHPPRCFATGDLGVSVLNPYMAYEKKECSYFTVDQKCVDADVFKGNVIFGTEGGGLYKTSWSGVRNSMCDVESPTDLSTNVETFTEFTGLLSQDIISVEANNDYLGVVTGSGLSYAVHGDSVYVNFTSTSGKSAFVTQDGSVFFAEGDRVLYKNTPAGSLTPWDSIYYLGAEVNDIWVSETGNLKTLFVATESGVHTFWESSSYSYGDANYSTVKAELGSTINQGHIFALTDSRVDIINMRLKELENSITYSGIPVVIIENKRLYSK